MTLAFLNVQSLETDTRLDRFFWGPYASQHVLKLFDRSRFDDESCVRMTYWSAPGDSKPGFEEAVRRLGGGEGGDVKKLKKGENFGPSWSNHWVKIEMTIPIEIRNAEQVICQRISL